MVNNSGWIDVMKAKAEAKGGIEDPQKEKGDANRALQTFDDNNCITLRIQGWVKRDSFICTLPCSFCFTTHNVLLYLPEREKLPVWEYIFTSVGWASG